MQKRTRERVDFLVVVVVIVTAVVVTKPTATGLRKSSSCDQSHGGEIIEPSPKRTRLVGYIVDEKRNNTNSNTNSKNKSKKSFD